MIPRTTLIGGVLLASLVVGCATIEQLAPPVDQVLLGAATVDDDSIAMLQDGRDVYITRCARCHSPEPVTAYTREEWQTILPRMVEEAGLSAEERLSVGEYIVAVLTAHERRLTTADAAQRH
ncbi:MAG: hypothetical protein KJO18_05525 [Acidimicrobiia bacterium]|nr:hypothetical protein [Acidimicrobiia bacterium]